jgi:uncharacterized protein YjiS (DUF1127 family)
MVNHHASGLFARLSETLHTWRTRYRARRELSGLSERDLHDIGMSSSDFIHEVSKPFWRA